MNSYKYYIAMWVLYSGLMFFFAFSSGKVNWLILFIAVMFGWFAIYEIMERRKLIKDERRSPNA